VFDTECGIIPMAKRAVEKLQFFGGLTAARGGGAIFDRVA